ncbi:MAG TPA: MoaD/ThiS family protein [Bacillota bacterium]
MITVHAQAFGNLRRFFPQGRQAVDFHLPEGSRVTDLLKLVGLPDNEVWMVSVNEALAEPDQTLADGDLVNVFAPVAGG